MRDQVYADEVSILAGGRLVDRLLGYILRYRDEAQAYMWGFRNDVMSGLYKTMVLGMRSIFPGRSVKSCSQCDDSCVFDLRSSCFDDDEMPGVVSLGIHLG